MKAEEKIVAFMFFFSCYAICIFIGKKTEFGGGGRGWRGTRAEGQEGQILMADNREIQ